MKLNQGTGGQHSSLVWRWAVTPQTRQLLPTEHEAQLRHSSERRKDKAAEAC